MRNLEGFVERQVGITKIYKKYNRSNAVTIAKSQCSFPRNCKI
jgi:hypothetical protein